MERWHEDTETYKFKTIYELEYSHIGIKILVDAENANIAAAYVTVKGSDYVEVDVKTAPLEEAKRRMIWAAINVGSSMLTKVNLDPEFREHLLDNLMALYKIQEDLIRTQKAALRNLFNKSRRTSRYDG